MLKRRTMVANSQIVEESSNCIMLKQDYNMAQQIGIFWNETD